MPKETPRETPRDGAKSPSKASQGDKPKDGATKDEKSPSKGLKPKNKGGTAKNTDKVDTSTSNAKDAVVIPVAVSKQTKQRADGRKKEIEYYTEELLSRPGLDPKVREGMGRKFGPPVQTILRERLENKRPPGRVDENAPSRHEQVPPASVVLMFNWCAPACSLTSGTRLTRFESRVLAHVCSP